MFKSAIRRSACDHCRARRVQCLRPQITTAPCARCAHISAPCVTSATGRPGRPRKQRLPTSSSTVQEVNRAEVHASAEPSVEQSWERLLDGDGFAESDLAASKSTTVMPHQLGDSLAVPDDGCGYYDSALIDQSPSTGEDMLALVDRQSGPSQPQGLPLQIGGESNGTAFEIDTFSPLLAPWKDDLLPPPSTLPQYSSPASALVQFREEIDQRIAAMDAFYSDPVAVAQSCKSEAPFPSHPEPFNPAALLLTSTAAFTAIIQQLLTDGNAALSTELVLVALSGYLSLMRLLDATFATMRASIAQLPPHAFAAVKVKSVLRVGGVAALQDLPLRTYAAGVLDAIRAQVRAVEACMGIPAEHCLAAAESAAAAGDEAGATRGILCGAERVRLFGEVLAQGDGSYVESIRANIEESMKFLDDQAN